MENFVVNVKNVGNGNIPVPPKFELNKISIDNYNTNKVYCEKSYKNANHVNSNLNSFKEELQNAANKFLKEKEIKIFQGHNFISETEECINPPETVKCEYCQREIEKVIINNHIDSHPSKILDWLYLGSFNNASNKKELKYANIQYILNSAVECQNEFKKDFVYKKLDLQDNFSENITQYFEEAFNFIEEARNNGSAVFVHCLMGKSRSATLVIAYLMKHLNMTKEEAVNFVKSKRKIIFPNYGFLVQLKEYETYLINQKSLK